MATLGARPATSVKMPEADQDQDEHYHRKAVLGIAVTQLIIGIIFFVSQLVLIVIKSPMHASGHGTWAGALFIITGLLGIASCKTKSSKLIVWFLVLGIFSSIITPVILGLSSAELALAQLEDTRVKLYGKIHVSNTYIKQIKEDYVDSYFRSSYPVDTVIYITTTMVALSVLQFVLLMVSSGFACHGLCCRPRRPETPIKFVVEHSYPDSTGQPHIVVSDNPQGPAPHGTGSTNPPPGAPSIEAPPPSFRSAVNPPQVLPRTSVYNNPQYDVVLPKVPQSIYGSRRSFNSNEKPL